MGGQHSAPRPREARRGEAGGRRGLTVRRFSACPLGPGPQERGRGRDPDRGLSEKSACLPQAAPERGLRV